MRIDTYYKVEVVNDYDEELLLIMSDLSDGRKRLCYNCKVIHNSNEQCPNCNAVEYEKYGRVDWAVFQCAPSAHHAGKRKGQKQGCSKWTVMKTATAKGSSFQGTPCGTCGKRQRLNPENYIRFQSRGEAVKYVNRKNCE